MHTYTCKCTHTNIHEFRDSKIMLGMEWQSDFLSLLQCSVLYILRGYVLRNLHMSALNLVE